jgi:hypothetical protein
MLPGALADFVGCENEVAVGGGVRAAGRHEHEAEAAQVGWSHRSHRVVDAMKVAAGGSSRYPIRALSQAVSTLNPR